MRRTLAELAEIVGGEARGDRDLAITGVKSLEEAGPSDLVLLSSPRFLKRARESGGGAFLVDPAVALDDRNTLAVARPKLAFARLLALFHPPAASPPGIHPLACVDPSARIDPQASIEAFAFVGPGCILAAGCRLHAGVVLQREIRIGRRTVLYPNVSVYAGVEIGDDCIIHSGTVIGSDGYGFVFDGSRHVKIPQVGGVRIGQNVEVGANCCIDRATLGSTEIGDGVKLDNFVHVGHNCAVGENSLLIAQVGLSGGTRVGKGVTLGGQVGTNPQVDIGDGSKVMGQSGVSKSVPAGSTVSGTPARDHQHWIRSQILMARLPEIYETLKALQEEVSRLREGHGRD